MFELDNQWDQKTDEELVRLSVANDDCFYMLMQRYEEKLIRYILRIVKANRETAEDILQEVFLKAYKNLNGFDDSLKFSSWVYRIAHNESISYWRKNQKNVDFVSIDKEENGLAKTLTGEDDTQAEALANERKEKIEELIGKLPDYYQEILVLRYLEEKDYDEISDILQKPIGTVSALIHRAKKKLEMEAGNMNIQDWL
ncbi:MAG TPA: RNA polymerase sigma factor [bacterium]|nr:RNA polymerase sigma factor [bacterium]